MRPHSCGTNAPPYVSEMVLEAKIDHLSVSPLYLAIVNVNTNKCSANVYVLIYVCGEFFLFSPHADCSNSQGSNIGRTCGGSRQAGARADHRRHECALNLTCRFFATRDSSSRARTSHYRGLYLQQRRAFLQLYIVSHVVESIRGQVIARSSQEQRGWSAPHNPVGEKTERGVFSRILPPGENVDCSSNFMFELQS